MTTTTLQNQRSFRIIDDGTRYNFQARYAESALGVNRVRQESRRIISLVRSFNSLIGPARHHWRAIHTRAEHRLDSHANVCRRLLEPLPQVFTLEGEIFIGSSAKLETS
jgi:hypothetical protein